MTPPPVAEAPPAPPAEAPVAAAPPEQPPAPVAEAPPATAHEAAAPPATEAAPPPAAETPAQPPAAEAPAAEAPAQSPAAEAPATETPTSETPASEAAPSDRPPTETPATSETPSDAPAQPQPESRPDVVAPAPADPDQLTPHFHLREFCVSDVAREEGIANVPTAQEREQILVAARGMEKVRALLGGKPITINSCFRTPVLNRHPRIRGVENSAHEKGYAVDFKCPSFGTPHEIVAHLSQNAELMAEVDQLIFECSRWVHISFEPRNPWRREVLTGYYQPGQGRKVFYLAGLHPLRDDGHLPNAQV